MRRLSALLLVVAGLSLVAVPAIADPPADLVCPDLDSGKIDTVGDPETVTVTAPDGYLIDSYCVKAGPGYLIIEVDPPQATVTIDHPLKDSVSHYSLSYVAITTTTEGTTSTTQSTTTTTDGSTSTSSIPSATTTSGAGDTTPTNGSTPTTSQPPAPSTTIGDIPRVIPDDPAVTSETLPYTGSGSAGSIALVASALIALGAVLVRSWRSE